MVLGGTESLDHPIGPEHLLVGVGGFRDAVGIDEEAGAGLQGEGIVTVTDSFHAADDEPVLILEQFKGAGIMADGGIFMAGAGGGEDTGGDFQNAEPHGHEHFLRVPVADLRVDFAQDFRRGKLLRGHMVDQGGREHHEQGGGNALAGYVADDQAQMIVVNEEEVIQVSTDLPGGGHGGIEIELMPVREGREDFGQVIGLDPGGQVQLRGNAFLFQLQGTALPGGTDIPGNDGGQIQHEQRYREPEHMHNVSGQPEGPGAQQGHEDEQDAEQAADAGIDPEKEEGNRNAEQGHNDELHMVRGFVLQVMLKEGLDDVGLVFHAVHEDRAVGSGDIGVLKGRGIGPDENHLAGPDRRGDPAVDKVQEVELVVKGTGLAGERHIVMAGSIHRRQGKGTALLFHIQAGGFRGHGIDAFAGRHGDIQQCVAHNAVHGVQHGVDMALVCDRFEGGIGLNRTQDSGGVQGNGMALIPGDFRSVFHHAGSDHIAQVFRGNGQLIIRGAGGFAFIKDIDGGHGGAVVRIRGKLLQGCGHIGTVIRPIGA